MNDDHGGLLVHLNSQQFRLVVAREFFSRVEAEGLVNENGFDKMMASARRVPGGRGSHPMLDGLRVDDEVIRVRPSRHGGFFGRLLDQRYWGRGGLGDLGDRFLSPRRPFREFEVWTTLHKQGIALPKPVLAIGRRTGRLWRTAFASADQPNALDGRTWLMGRPSQSEIRIAISAFAKTLKRFHDAGAIHGDLQIGNVLVEPDRDREDGDQDKDGKSLLCMLVDLDRTTITPSVSPRQRTRELIRFARSLEKSGHRDLSSKRVYAQFISNYCGNDRALRSAMLSWARVEMLSLTRHRIAWRIGRLLGRSLVAFCLVHSVGCTDEQKQSIDHDPRQSRWSLLATGDIGRTSLMAEVFEGQYSVARVMKQEARRKRVDALIFLGDIFYWNGLDHENLVPRIRVNLVRPYCYFLDLTGARSEEVSNACPVDLRMRAPVPVFAVLGNHDTGTPVSVMLEREAIPDFLPGWQMSPRLAMVKEVTPGISLILFESELAIRDPDAIKKALNAAITEALGPWIILAAHRPIATDDLGFPPHGGYPAFVHDAIVSAGRPVQLVLAGHHHSLQAFQVKAPAPALHLGLGSGSRALPPLAEKHPGIRFSARALGFARIDLVGDGFQERLAVSIIDAPRWPWLAFFQDSKVRARFDVDINGRVQRILSP